MIQIRRLKVPKGQAYLIRGGHPDRRSLSQKAAPPGLFLVQMVKDGTLLITTKEKIIYRSPKLSHLDEPEITTQFAKDPTQEE
jgi:hypothetical protein